MKIYDNFYDSKFIMDAASYLAQANIWSADNVANRYSHPYGHRGTHIILGHRIFTKANNHYTQDKILFDIGIEIFKGIEKLKESQLNLLEITANLQFKGMNGTFHKDGSDDQTAYILMLTNEFLGDDVGGKFINDTEKKEIDFKNGRLIEFNANDLHKANSFNLDNALRFSIKIVIGGNNERYTKNTS